jgi:hypothetical protein
MIARKQLDLPPKVARAFVDDMRAYFIGNGFCLSVPELIRSAGIQLNRRLSLRHQFLALSSSTRYFAIRTHIRRSRQAA